MATHVQILGPQEPDPNLHEALDAAGVGGRVVAITAGRRHDESEVDRLSEQAGRPVEILPLYAWFDELAAEEPELAATYHDRQRRIMAYKELYRLRMRAGLAVVRELWERLPEDPELVRAELDRATAQVRQIDAEAFEEVDRIRRAFPDVDQRFGVPAVSRRRELARKQLEGVGAILLAGGHVAVLRNRLMFFDVHEILRSRAASGVPIVAWGAGAMVLCRRIVLFYDDPPEGPSEAELLDFGVGLVPNVVLFPHARRRLRLERADRISGLASRFAPAACIALENGAWLEGRDGSWWNRGRPGTALWLRPDGRVLPLEDRG